MKPQDGKQTIDILTSKTTNEDTAIEIIRSAKAFESFMEEWDALFEASPTAAPPLRRTWLQTWWRFYGPVYGARSGEDEGLRILVARRGGQMIGALPLYLRRPARPLGPRRLGFVSTGEAECEEVCAERLDMLYRPGEEQTCLSLFYRGLMENSPQDWDELDLSPIPATSPLLSWASRKVPEQPRLCVEPVGPCFVADLKGGLEAYLMRLSQKNRGRARRYLRDSNAAGARMERAQGAEQIERMLEQLVDLHQARWQAAGKPGCFAAPRFKEFHRSLLHQGIGTGQAVLARLSLHQEPLALILGYVSRSKFDCYVTGARIGDTGPIRSPGIFALLLLQAQFVTEGITCYDHLGGAMEYKEQFSTHEELMVGLSLSRATFRATLQQARLAVKSAAKKALEK